jgi:ParB/RepB/Spo0J family partition protein
MTQMQTLQLPDGWELKSGRAGYLARRIADGAHTIAFPAKADAIQAAHNLEAAAADPKVAGMSQTTAKMAATNSMPPSSSPVLPDELRLAGWTIEKAGREHRDDSTVEAWKIENRSLGIPWTVLYAGVDTAIETARKQQAEKIGYMRPLEMDAKQTVRIDEIVPSRWQPRRTFDESSLAELAESIREHGILNPLQVIYNERCEYELIAGERRLRAATMLGLETVPVEVKEYTPRQCQEIAIIDNLQREQLSDIDEGYAYERLIVELGISENELAKRLGKNRSYIQQRRALARSAPEVQQALAEGKLTLSQARAIAQAAPGDHKSQQKALKEIQQKIGYGQTITEARAREMTEAEVRKRVKKDLEALGWKVEGQLVWSAGERPQTWTGGEMLAAVQEQRRPAGQAVQAVQLTSEQRTAIKLRYNIVSGNDYDPWIKINEEWTTQSVCYLAPAELVELAAEMEQAWTALQARYQAAGWTVEHQNNDYFVAVSPKGRRESCHSWAKAVATIEEIEAGKLSPEKPKEPEYKPSKQKCCRCNKMVSQWRYRSSGTYCLPCNDAREAEIAAERAAVRERVVQLVGTSLDAVPVDVLRLLTFIAGPNYLDRLIGTGYIEPEEKGRRFQAADEALLRETLIDAMAAKVYRSEVVVVPQLVEAEQPQESTA